MSADLVASITAFLITVMVLSYLAGDNLLFRLAVHLFVGVAAGYVAAVAWWQVLLPRLVVPLLSGAGSARAALALPMLLSGLLLMKAWPPLARLGAPALGLIVGVASAVAVAGSLQGTLGPQLAATVDGMALGSGASLGTLINGGLVMMGLIATLVYFQFSAKVSKDGSLRRPRIVELIALVGSAFIAVTLGALFAGVYAAALTALIERMRFMLGLIGLG